VIWGLESVVSIATRYELDCPGIESRWGRDFLHLSRPALGPTQPPIQWVPGLSRGQSGRRVALTTHPHLVPRLTLFNPIFLPTAYSPALICFWRERGWWITCNYPIVLKEKNIEKQKEYNLRYMLAKVRTTWGKESDRLRQRPNKRNKHRVGRLPTSERNREIILSDEVRRRIGKG
jgi:hypothetical protein